MAKKLYVGNLPYSMEDADLREQFGRFGEVVSASVVTDRDSGRSKGFAFVEMGSSEAAQDAIQGLNGKSFGDRPLVVNVARPREPRAGGNNPSRSNRW